MGLIANRMAVELFCRLGEKWKKKRESRQISLLFKAFILKMEKKKVTH